jgi:hypothetical protein
MTRPNRQPARLAALALHRAQFLLPLLFLLLTLAVLTAGCAAASNDSGAELRSPDAVHEAWVAAVREGNGDAALALVDPELAEREPFAREAVSRMREYLTSPASPTGALEGVTVERVADGVGRSVWQFAQKRWCYRAELVSRAERWYVSRWGQTSVDCR